MKTKKEIWTVLLLFAVLWAPLATLRAQPPINYQQVHGRGFLGDAELERYLGTLSFSMTECGQVGLGTVRRSVRVTSTKSNYRYAQVIDSVLYRAAEFAWRTCPLYFIFGVSRTSELQYNIDLVQLYLPDGSEAIRAHGFWGDDTFHAGKAYKWNEVLDIGEQNRQEAERKAAEAQLEAQRAEWRARQEAESAQFWSSVWSVIKLLFWLGIAGWLFSMRETFMRWYYFLTPHPAKSMVDSAIHRGLELDGRAFADIMRPVPGGRIEKAVRAQQANQLAQKAHRYAEEMRAEADRLKAKAQQETEFIKAQDELLKAATAHEKAKARLDALRKRVES